MAKTKGFKFEEDTTEPVTITCDPSGELAGLEITVRGRVPAAVLFGNGVEAAQAFRDSVISWNVTDADDKLIPFTPETFGRIVNARQALQLINVWVGEMANPSGPLSLQSSVGALSDSGVRRKASQ